MPRLGTRMSLAAVGRELLKARGLATGTKALATAGELSEGASSFWTDVDIQDLPGSSVDAEVLRRHNSSFPFYKKQVVVGKVIGVERDHVAIYTGELQPYLGQHILSSQHWLNSSARFVHVVASLQDSFSHPTDTDA